MAKKKTPFNIWETTNNNGIEKRYIRMGVTQMSHPSFRSLSHSAVRVYIHMKLESGGSKDFTFPRSKYKAYLSSGGFQSAKQELCEIGFINEVENNKNLRKANVYAFSTKWKDYF